MEANLFVPVLTCVGGNIRLLTRQKFGIGEKFYTPQLLAKGGRWVVKRAICMQTVSPFPSSAQFAFSVVVKCDLLAFRAPLCFVTVAQKNEKCAPIKMTLL